MINSVVMITQHDVDLGKLENELLGLGFSVTQVRQHFMCDTLDGFGIRMSSLFTNVVDILDTIHKSCEECRITVLTPQGQAYAYTKEGAMNRLGTYSKIPMKGEVATSCHTFYIPKSQATYLIK